LLDGGAVREEEDKDRSTKLEGARGTKSVPAVLCQTYSMSFKEGAGS